MKQSQNNWEESIGNRLRDAETTPERHVWELLEMELDTQGASTKRKTYKITAAAVILLLIAASFIFQLANNTADLAKFTTFNLPTYADNFVIQSNYSEAKEVDLIASNEPKAKDLKAKKATRKVKKEVEKLNSAFTLETASTAAINIEEFRNSKHVSLAAIDAMISFNQAPITNQSLKKSNLNFVGLDENRNNILSIIGFSDVEQLQDNVVAISHEPSNAFIKYQNFKVNHIALQSENWFFDETNSLNASQQTNKLSKQRALTLGQGLYASNNVLSNASKFKTEKLDLESLLENDEVLAEQEVEQMQHWLANVEEELAEWENLVEASKIDDIPVDVDDEILKEIIEEAELDKEDPLSILQEEANNLYYAKSIDKGFHVGIVTGFQNSWITKNSRNPEVDRDNTKTLFSPGYQVGLNVGYDFAKHFGLMAEFKYSDEGVRFHNPEKDRIEHLDLKYIEIPIFLKAKHSMQTAKMKPIVFNYLLGVNFSDLRNVNSYAGGVEKRFAQDYNTSEWGITAGFDFDYYINKSLFITVGTRGSVNGFNNNAFDNEGSTLSYNLGIYTRFNFRIAGR